MNEQVWNSGQLLPLGRYFELVPVVFFRLEVTDCAVASWRARAAILFGWLYLPSLDWVVFRTRPMGHVSKCNRIGARPTSCFIACVGGARIAPER